jgi:eukaryotic-like serine/threonine-protein kinase
MIARPFHCDESRLRSLLDDDMPELEQAELNDHLETCAACRRTLERLAAGSQLWAGLRELAGATEEYGTTGRVGAIAERDHSLDFLAPSTTAGSLGRLGPYEVTELLGRGGFGVVLKAVDQALGRLVAIKVLAPQLATNAAARGRFAREARAAAAVVHDHVVAIHAVDSWNNLPYLVMPFVAGRSLQERVDRDGPLGVKEVLRIGIQTARGLAAAHAQGLVHRDVKPSNILLENGVERVKLTDFGLARAVDDASLTQSGVVTGTPQYISPEQARGEPVDHRSDLFSLGSVLYFMCAGHSPFRASSTPAVLRRVSDDRPRPLREVNLDVPDWLAAIVDRLHEKDPASRFQSATLVADTLAGLLSDVQRGVPITVQPKMPAPRHKKPRGRKPMIAAAVMIPALALAVAAYENPGSIFPFLPFMSRPESPDASNGAAGIGQEGKVSIVTQGGALTSRVTSDDPSKAMITGSGHPATKVLPVADFDSLEIRHPFQVEVTRADQFGVTVTADDNVLEHVKALKEGSALKIDLEEGKIYRVKTGSLKAVIRMPALARLGLSHGARGTVRGFKSNQGLNLRASHGSALEGEVEAGDIDIAASHGSTLHLKGKARDGRLDVSHGSALSVTDLALRSVEIDVEHGSTAGFDARSTEGLKVTANHGSIVTGSVEAGNVTVETGHSSQVTLKGRALRADIAASHGSRLALGGLALDAAKVDLGQASSATVNAKDALDYQLDNGSSLKYLGKPKLGKSRSSRSSSAKSISADEAAREKPVPPKESSKPAELTQKDIFISTINWGGGVIRVGSDGGGAIVGSGNPATKTWEVAGFDRVQIRSTFRAEIIKGTAFKVTTTADDNVIPHIAVEKEGTTLKISLASGSYGLNSPLKAEITLPTLVGLDITGASKGTLKGFQSERELTLKISGASHLDGGIAIENGTFNVDGASTLSLAGSAQMLRLSGDGASHFKLGEFIVKDSQLDISGASTAQITVKSDQDFKAKLSDASNLKGSIQAKEIDLDLDGASHATLDGSANDAKIHGDGASDIKMPGLVLQTAEVNLSGASHASVDARGKLKYELSSASSLTYQGKPSSLEGKKSGGSSISRAR